MLCSWGERAPPPGLTAKPHFHTLYLTGHGDQRDVPSKNSEGSGGWGHSRDKGTGGHHWVHQAGADSKSGWQVKPLLSLSVGCQVMRNTLCAKLSQGWSGISVSIILNKTRELFVLLSFTICQTPSLLLSSQIVHVSHSSYQVQGSKHRQREKGRRASVFVIYS